MALRRGAAGLVGTARGLAARIRARLHLAAVSLLDVRGRRRRRLAVRQADLARRNHALQSSRELLRTCLRAEQLDQFDRAGWFMVSGRIYDYRINQGSVANVELMARDGSYLRRLCFYPALGGGRELPVFDVMLAQKLMLEADEWSALAVAVGHP